MTYCQRCHKVQNSLAQAHTGSKHTHKTNASKATALAKDTHACGPSVLKCAREALTAAHPGNETGHNSASCPPHTMLRTGTRQKVWPKSTHAAAVLYWYAGSSQKAVKIFWRINTNIGSLKGFPEGIMGSSRAGQQ